LESFAKLKNQDWELHIAGGDEEGEALKEQAERLGVINRIKFLGKVKDIDREYAKAGIYVIPSRSEGFPNALAEAMAAGCCCIAFDFVAGPRDIIVDGISGLIIENGNTTEMAKAIDYLIAHPEKRIQLRKEAIKIREKLNENLIAEKIKRFINF
jgi:glycosyltransferase involved in cell wall biosynthesis